MSDQYDWGVRARVIRVRELSPQDEVRWRALAARSIEPNPYFEPDALVLCTRHFAEFSDAYVVVAEEADSFYALLPLVKFQGARIPPRRVATTLGNRLRSLGTPLVDGRHLGEG